MQSRLKTTATGALRRLAPHLPFKNSLYHLSMRIQPRKNSPYTQFYRFHRQYDVIVDRALPFVLEEQDPGSNRSVEVLLFGCSTGAEPYSLASVLMHRMPDLDFHIRAFDLVPELVEQAEIGIYEPAEVYRSPFIDADFVDRTLERDGDHYRIRNAVREKVTFGIGDVLDRDFMASLGTADLVFAQNFLFHLKRPAARAAFRNLASLLKARSVLVVNGMDYDMRVDLTKEHSLEPVSYLIEEVHNDAFANAGELWFTRYYGRIPFSTQDADWVRKYSTVFLAQN